MIKCTKRLFLIYLLVWISLNSLLAQIVLPDSIRSKMAILPGDSARMRYLNNLAWNFRQSNPDFADKLCRLSLQIISTAGKDCYASADATGILGNIADNHDHFEEALGHYRNAYRMAKSCNILNLEASNLNNMGLVFQRQQRYDSAYAFLNQALDLKKKIGNRASMASTLNNLGLVEYHRLHYREALRFFLHSLKIKEEFNERKSQGTTLLNISNIYKELGIKDSAYNFLRRSIAMRRESGDLLGLAYSYNNLAILEKDDGNLIQAARSLDEAEFYARKVASEETLARIANNRSEIFLQQGNNKAAQKFASQALVMATSGSYTRTAILALNNLGKIDLKERQPQKALISLRRALQLADSIHDIVGRRESLKNLVQAENEAGNQAEARTDLERYQQLNDSIVYKNLGKELAAIQKSYDLLKARQLAGQMSLENQKKDAELAGARYRDNQKAWVIAVLILILVVLGLGLILYFRLKKARDQEKLKVASYEAREAERKRLSRDIHDELGLQLSRIALSAETALLLDSGREQQQEVLSTITRLSRETITNLSDLVWYLNPDQTSLNQFLYRLREQISGYLQECSINYQLEMDLPEEVRMTPEKQRQMHLMLKEAVHNAVKHAKANNISVTSTLSNGKVQLLVSDDGSGFQQEKISSGNGLKNMHHRTAQLGGSLQVSSQQGVGTQLHFEIPLETAG